MFITEINPVVGVITARDTVTAYLYGIANNGRSYVISKDGGITWDPFFDDAYANYTSESGDSIEWAQFVTPGV